MRRGKAFDRITIIEEEAEMIREAARPCWPANH
jgi:hypothetical protein